MIFRISSGSKKHVEPFELIDKKKNNIRVEDNKRILISQKKPPGDGIQQCGDGIFISELTHIIR